MPPIMRLDHKRILSEDAFPASVGKDSRMGRPPYVELRARSAFSFLEGATAPEDLATGAAALGYDAIALGDRDGLYGAPRFYQAATEAKIKAIVGAELVLDSASFGLALDTPSRLYVLVPDRERYRNLCRMLTAAKLRVIGTNTDGSPRYPAKGESRITFDDIERYGHGLIALAGGALSPLARMLTRGDDPRPLTDRLSAVLGRGNCFIDIQRHLDPDEERLNRRLLGLATASRIPIVTTNDVCFMLGAAGTPRTVSASPEMHACVPADAIRLNGGRTASQAGPPGSRWHPGDNMERALLDVMTCIRLGVTLEEAGRALWVNHERHLKPPAAMAALFP